MVNLAAVLGCILRGAKFVWEHKALPVHAFAVSYFVVGYPAGCASNLSPYSFYPKLFRYRAGSHSLWYGVLHRRDNDSIKPHFTLRTLVTVNCQLNCHHRLVLCFAPPAVEDEKKYRGR